MLVKLWDLLVGEEQRESNSKARQAVVSQAELREEYGFTVLKPRAPPSHEILPRPCWVAFLVGRRETREPTATGTSLLETLRHTQ